MAMNVGSGTASSDPDVMMDINTTPLIDVMLVLLVMLIITLPIQLHAINLNMPTGNPPPPLVLPQVVKIDIDPNGVTYWNGEVVADRAALGVPHGEARLLGADRPGADQDRVVRRAQLVRRRPRLGAGDPDRRALGAR